MSNLILYFNYYYCTYSSFFKGAEYVTLLVYKGKHKIQDRVTCPRSCCGKIYYESLDL